MSGPHLSGDSRVPENLLDSVSLVSKTWHPTIDRYLSESAEMWDSDIERQIDTFSPNVLTDALAALASSIGSLAWWESHLAARRLQ